MRYSMPRSEPPCFCCTPTVSLEISKFTMVSTGGKLSNPPPGAGAGTPGAGPGAGPGPPAAPFPCPSPDCPFAEPVACGTIFDSVSGSSALTLYYDSAETPSICGHWNCHSPLQDSRNTSKVLKEVQHCRYDSHAVIVNGEGSSPEPDGGGGDSCTALLGAGPGAKAGKGVLGAGGSWLPEGEAAPASTP